LRAARHGHNPVERFFADLTADVVRAGSFASVGELARDINAYLAARNADPKPYRWRARGADILAKIIPAPAPHSTISSPHELLHAN
jgi:hypothetical protein